MVFSKENSLFLLQKNALFREASGDQITLLLRDSEFKIFKKRTCFVNSKLITNFFYVIFDGRIKVYFYDESKDRKITLFILTRHDVFNVYRLLDYKSFNIFYETLDDLSVMQTPISVFKTWVSKNPKFNAAILHYLILKMSTLEKYVTASCLDSTTTKLARVLLNNASSNKSLIDGLPHKEIAQYIGTTRAVLNRHLQKFKDDGIIEIQNKTITIRNLELLKKHL
ncbi:Crp/Fnr family transcriptional regulator [Tamlana fucoidanivorans]|uniref:Crp/Fnr family transcriptional regulator n=1 Tax=Allotamlana fucoidanivorans TaxID=2583814 RepID=A0A5C4SS84_9FLAO|nr:Crp/Fnr family transcriptional regulator [Tamlana fucoidanivorans]TNJ46413.1 Crp/Fnr family transcriptional regulator [Tamlana fucoidanivorans]